MSLDRTGERERESFDIPVTKAFMPFFVPGTLNACVRLYEKPTRKTEQLSQKIF